MEKSLRVIEQQEVVFYEDVLIAIRAEDGHIYVSVRHLAEALGLNPTGQIRRIRRQSVLEKGYFKGDILTAGGRQKANWLRVDLVPLFLTGVSTKSVKESLRSKLEKFQTEASKVLWEAFQEGQLSADPSFDELLETDSPAAQAYKTFQALTKLARSQLILESRVADHEKRLEAVEASLGDPDRYISNAQASRISQAVKAVAMAFSKQSGRNEYGGVYGQLYRKFEIASYRELPASKYEDAMAWLSDWYRALTNSDDDIPF